MMNLQKQSLTQTSVYEELIKNLESFDNQARIWIHILTTNPSSNDRELIQNTLRKFTNNWTTHNKPSPGSFIVYKNRIIILINNASISGCSIDTSYQTVNRINRELGGGIEFPLYYISIDNKITGVKREDIAVAISDKKILRSTPIINTQLTTLAELRAHKLEQPAHQTWLAKYFN